jgi:hypothetical protein
VSWQAIALRVRTDNISYALDESLTFYGLSEVGLGGNWRLVKCNLAVSPPTCTSLDTGVGVPSTDGHYNLRELLLEGDYIYACWARWSALNCYRFHKDTGVGASIGSVAPGGDTSINYHVGVKTKEDTYYYMARVGTGTEWKLWRFKGSPSQITDSRQWEFIDYIFRDPTSPIVCPEGSINYSYCTTMFWVHERYLLFHCYQRCPTGNIGNFAIYIFDTVKEKLYNSNFEEIPFGIPTTDPRVKITVTNPPANAVIAHVLWKCVVDMANRRYYARVSWNRSDRSLIGSGILKVDMVTRRATYVQIPGDYAIVQALTSDGKVIFTNLDPDNVVRVKLFDPTTDTVTDIMDTPLSPDEDKGSFHTVRLNTEDVQIPVQTMLPTRTHLILAPNWQDGLKIPKRIVVSSPRAGQLRVQTQFQLAPANIRVRLWKIPDLTIIREETLAGATSIDRTYSVTAGRYRAEVTAL